MQPTFEHIQKFQAFVKAKSGEVITFDEAEAGVRDLITMAEVILDMPKVPSKK